MRKTRFSEAKIIEVLKHGEGGVKVDEIYRQHGISRQTYYAWRRKYGGLTASEAKCLRESSRTRIVASRTWSPT